MVRRMCAVLAAATTAVVVGFLVPAASAFADTADDGADPGDPITPGVAILVYIGIPALIIAVIWVLASLPSIVRGSRYRPGSTDTVDELLVSGQSLLLTDGSPSAETERGALPAAADGEVGGTSARW